jgi:predicted enzyme related to lactoylglutathione lyase
MLIHETITYLEFAAEDLSATKKFFEDVFHWDFTDYGPEYSAHTSKTVEVGFFKGNGKSVAESGGALTVFFSDDLESSLQKVMNAKAHISKSVFEFPGGRRFHFIEPSGNEFGVWSNKKANGDTIGL